MLKAEVMKMMPGLGIQLACPPEPWRRQMLLARFGGDSVSVNPFDGLGFQAVKPVPLDKMPCNFIQVIYNEQLTT
jgi:hypothetical protein